MLAWPIGALAVPVVLRALRRRRPYPWAVDAALALPFALDSAGNVLDLYNRWVSYDTVNHGISWFALTMLVSSIPVLGSLPSWARAWIVAGSGAFAAIAWELGEYAAFIHSSHYTRSAYPDTLTDLLAGCSGSVLAAALVLLAAQGTARRAVPAPATRVSRLSVSAVLPPPCRLHRGGTDVRLVTRAVNHDNASGGLPDAAIPGRLLRWTV
jgi:hypothetical protein